MLSVDAVCAFAFSLEVINCVMQFKTLIILEMISWDRFHVDSFRYRQRSAMSQYFLWFECVFVVVKSRTWEWNNEMNKVWQIASKESAVDAVDRDMSVSMRRWMHIVGCLYSRSSNTSRRMPARFMTNMSKMNVTSVTDPHRRTTLMSLNKLGQRRGPTHVYISSILCRQLRLSQA